MLASRIFSFLTSTPLYWFLDFVLRLCPVLTNQFLLVHDVLVLVTSLHLIDRNLISLTEPRYV